jgi:hypothetical protein
MSPYRETVDTAVSRPRKTPSGRLLLAIAYGLLFRMAQRRAFPFFTYGQITDGGVGNVTRRMFRPLVIMYKRRWAKEALDRAAWWAQREAAE